MSIKKGDQVIFKGYSEEPEDGMNLLTEGESYEVVEVNADEKSVVVRIDNPDYNAKKKESEDNPKTILLDIFEEEYSLPEGKAKAAKKAKAAPAEETAEEEAEAEEPVAKKAPAKKAEAKAKGNGKVSPIKAVSKLKEPAPKKEAVDEDPYADLTEENEDKEILNMVNEAEDILDLAKEVSEEASAIEYKLGGVLFHVRKTGAYMGLDARYKEKGGFSLYVLEQLNVEYRKAMYLIDIYYKWNKFGLDADKVAAIGWAKAAKIAAVMTEDTAEELLELAETNTVADLIENIKTSYKEVGGEKGEKKVLKTFKFRLFEEQAASVEEILNAVASSMGYTRLDDAFEHIIVEWATEHHIGSGGAQTQATGKTAPTKAKARAAA